MTDALNSSSQLRVGAHVLIQLGKELVTDPEQALLELVKNAYDADSPRCEIVVNTRETGELVQIGSRSKFQLFCKDTDTVSASLLDDDPSPIDEDMVVRKLRYTGSIKLRDWGVGLSENAVKNSWLVVSNSIKRVANGQPKPKTQKGRTPLGDKGLGRLGTMRLGDILHLRSAKKGSDTISIAWFRWKDCEGAETLDRIPVEIDSEPNSEGFFGTEVSIYGIDDITDWRNVDRAKQLSYSIASIVSPFEAVDTFPISVRIDDIAYDLEKVTNDLLNQAVSDFSFRFEADEQGDYYLHSTARFRKGVFLASTKQDAIARAERIFGANKGLSFLSWLKGESTPDGFQESRWLRKYDQSSVSTDSEWTIELYDRVPFSKIVKNISAQISNPGSFSGALYYFNFGRSGASSIGEAATRERFRRMKGVAILRDGFRIRSGEDWLDLARSMTSGSTYHLRVDNTAGYFALTGEQNFQLTEKSDREGFVDDAFYRGFLAISDYCKRFANRAQEDVRRGLDEYSRMTDRHATGASHMSTPVALKTISKTVTSIGAAAKTATSLVEAQKKELAQLGNAQNTSSVKEQAHKAMELARMGLGQIESLTNDIKNMRDLAAAGTIVAQQIELRSEQVTALIESAAVGLAARGLTHEIHTHLSEIEKSTHQVRQVIKKTSYAETVLPRLRHIDLARRSISGAASQIDPMLPRTRAVKEKIALASFIGNYISNREQDLSHEGITAKVIQEADTIVLINRNRLLQVLDNLVKNSRYWLQTEDAPKFGERVVEIQVNVAGIIVSDNGPGVEKRIEDSLFELFVSDKPDDGSGQGLGLYITSQLLMIDGCTIELLPERNCYGRRYMFGVDFSKIIEKKVG